MDFEDFEFSDEEFAEDNTLTIVDNAKLEILKKMEETIAKLKSSIKLNEETDTESLTEILIGDTNIFLDLQQIDEDNASDEEITELVEAARMSSTKLTFANIDEIVQDQNDDADENEDSEDDTTDNSLDF